MPQHQHDLGTIGRDRTDGGATLRLERDFDATPDELWHMLTDPAELAGWLHATVELEPRPGGAITLRFTNTDTTIHGRIVRFDAPTVLEYSWRAADEPASLVRFELRPVPAAPGTRLSLTHSRCAGTAVSEMAAGWHHHLELLAAQLVGQPVGWDWPHFQELYARYGAFVA